jgi:hypothetical protein
MVFESLKKKFRKNSGIEEYERIKAEILSQKSEDKNAEIEKPLIESFRTGRRFGIREETPTHELILREPLERRIEERAERFKRDEREEYEPGFLRFSEPKPITEEGYGDVNIDQRLRIIEEQLSAIKAQNELIIERIKSLERRLGYV